jgi:replication factor C subunit 2/4
MRQAINTLQACMTGFGELSEVTVFKVVDQPHPALLQNVFLFLSALCYFNLFF